MACLKEKDRSQSAQNTIQTRTQMSMEWLCVSCWSTTELSATISDVVYCAECHVFSDQRYHKIFSYVRPIIIETGIKTGIRVVSKNPRQVGADRIVDAAAAYELYGGPAIVVDYGTATTFDLIDADGAFTACVIAPGIRTSAQSLWSMAAKLPEFEIRKPDSILAQDTITCMQAGLVYGQIGQTEYIIRKIKEESGLKDIKVVATGGLGVLIEKETELIDIYDPMLTLKGMRLIFEKQKKH